METAEIIIYIVAVILAIFGVVALARKDKKVIGVNKFVVGIVALFFGVGIIALQMGWLVQISSSLTPLAFSVSEQTQNPTIGSTDNVGVNPAATYATQDKFSTSSVSGTSYYRRNGGVATTTSLSNVNPGVEYTYWVSNGTSYYVAPYKFTATKLNNNIVSKLAYANTSITLTGYDNVARATVTSGNANVSLPANGNANIEITYQGVSKKSNIPFGGLLVIDMNSTISSVTCNWNGAQLASNSKYHITYNPSSTDHKIVSFEVPDTFDTGLGLLNRINCQFLNGAGAKVGDSVKFDMISANYYNTNAGEIVLDTEKFANDDTTRTGLLGTTALTAYWKA